MNSNAMEAEPSSSNCQASSVFDDEIVRKENRRNLSH
jgi:hypothetical protein